MLALRPCVKRCSSPIRKHIWVFFDPWLRLDDVERQLGKFDFARRALFAIVGGDSPNAVCYIAPFHRCDLFTSLRRQQERFDKSTERSEEHTSELQSLRHLV